MSFTEGAMPLIAPWPTLWLLGLHPAMSTRTTNLAHNKIP